MPRRIFVHSKYTINVSYCIVVGFKFRIKSNFFTNNLQTLENIAHFSTSSPLLLTNLPLKNHTGILSLKYTNLVPASGPLYLRFPLPGLFCKPCRQLAPSYSLCLGSNVLSLYKN